MLAAVFALTLQTQWITKLPSGATVKLVAVMDAYTKAAWTPAGTRQNFPTKDFLVTAEKDKLRMQKAVAFVLDFDHQKLKEFPDVLMSIGSNSTYALSTGYTSMFPTKLPYRSIGAFYLPKNMKNADLDVFVASGPWKTLGKYGPKTKRAEGLSFHPTIEIVNGPADSKGVKTQVAQIKIVAPESLAKSKGVYRLAAFDQKGKKMKSAGALTRSGEQSPSEFMFEPEGKSIGRLELEYRPYEPLKFSSVALQPKS